MTFLPIVERELREGARRPATRYIRLGIAALALAIGLFQLAFLPFFMGFGRTSGSGGFLVMTGYAFLLCVLAGVFVTADCLSEEKREGTLGLLFLTDLRGYDVVLGKLAAQFIHLGYALIAIIPAAALPLLFGGVTGGEVWRISLALLNLLFFALAAGVLASTVCRQAGFAMALAAGLLAFFCLGVPLLQGLAELAAFNHWFGWLSPTQAYVRALDARFLAAPGRYWIALGGSHLLGWLFIALASWRLPWSWQDRPARSAPTDSVLAHLTGTARDSRTRRRRELLDQNPWLWLIGERRGIKLMMTALTAVWGGVVGLFALVNVESAGSALLMGGYFYLFVTKILFATQACRFFVETRRAGAFELLLATPIRSEQLVAAQWTALRRAFGPALIAAGLICLGYVALLIGTQLTGPANQRSLEGLLSITMIFGLLGGLVQFLDFIALGYVGMWLALTMRKPHLASGATILFILLLPFITLSCAAFVGFILDVILIAVFSSKLNTDLRQVLLAQSTRSPDLTSPAAA